MSGSCSATHDLSHDGRGITASCAFTFSSSSENGHLAEARAEPAFRSRQGTLIVIAHRASSALRADRILPFDGTRASFGEHRHLVETSELYAELVGHSRHTAGSRR